MRQFSDPLVEDGTCDVSKLQYIDGWPFLAYPYVTNHFKILPEFAMAKKR
jgi:hypothetical protein